jgi:hypothetical protein
MAMEEVEKRRKPQALVFLGAAAFLFRVGDRTRTGNNQIHSADNPPQNVRSANDLQRQAPAFTRPLHTDAETAPDSDLARVIAAWPNTPAHIRAAILALIGTAH